MVQSSEIVVSSMQSLLSLHEYSSRLDEQLANMELQVQEDIGMPFSKSLLTS